MKNYLLVALASIILAGCTADSVNKSEAARQQITAATTNPIVDVVETLDPTGWAKIASEVVGGGLAAWVAIDRALAAHLKRKNAMATAGKPTELNGSRSS